MYTDNRYDWDNGRNLNAVKYQQGNIMWSVEFSNGTSYYVDIRVCCCPASPFKTQYIDRYDIDSTAFVQAGKCKSIKFPVGILRCVLSRPGL